VYATARGVFTCVGPQCTGVAELLPATTNGAPAAIAVVGGDVYVAFEGSADNGYLDGSIVRCAVTGCAGGAFVLAKAQEKPTSISVDATHVYWGSAGGTVQRVAK
jgi:hypothetical protein